jgi:mannose-6-phosphate isomerase-like protein (cupin superfamily)
MARFVRCSKILLEPSRSAGYKGDQDIFLKSVVLKEITSSSEENELPILISQPTRIQAAGTKPKLIDEYVGRVNSKTQTASVAHMRSPAGWKEPGQRPEFDEFTIVLKGTVRVKHADGAFDVRAGQAVIAHKGEWIQYSTPEGAEYIAVCLPAFSPETVHRDS